MKWLTLWSDALPPAPCGITISRSEKLCMELWLRPLIFSATSNELHQRQKSYILCSAANAFISLLHLHCQRCVRSLCWPLCHKALQTPCVCESIQHCSLLACQYLWQRVTAVSRMINGDQKFHSLNSVEVSFISSLSRGLSRKTWIVGAVLQYCAPVNKADPAQRSRR